MKEKKTSHLSKAMLFILLFGIVSLFSDMTHEGASSIRGAYLSLLGASAGMIGFISGFGELIGYSMRYIFGKITDKTKKYWPMTILGYLLDILAVPSFGTCWGTWVDHGFYFTCYSKNGKSHQKASQRYHHVFCGITGRFWKKFWYSGIT